MSYIMNIISATFLLKSQDVTPNWVICVLYDPLEMGMIINLLELG